MEQLLQLIVLALRTLVNTVFLHRDPIGISLSESLCFSSFGCENYTFINYNFAMWRDKRTDNVKIIRLKKTNWLGHRSVKCSAGSEIVLSRWNKHICLETDIPPEYHTTPNYRLQNLRAKGYRETRWKKQSYLHQHYKEKKTWNDARKRCRRDGGQLAQLKENFKWRLVYKVMDSPRDILKWSTWIGLRYNSKKGRYQWFDGSPMLDKSRWLKGKISHKKSFFSGLCGALKMSKSKYFLANFKCSSKSRFLCEVKR